MFIRCVRSINGSMQIWRRGSSAPWRIISIAAMTRISCCIHVQQWTIPGSRNTSTAVLFWQNAPETLAAGFRRAKLFIFTIGVNNEKINHHCDPGTIITFFILCELLLPFFFRFSVRGPDGTPRHDAVGLLRLPGAGPDAVYQPS